EGRFTINARLDVEELRLRPTTDEGTGEAVFVAPGVANVELRIVSAGELAGVVLLDPSVPRDAVWVHAERTNPQVEDGSTPNARPSQLDEHGAFTLKQLRPGTYTVRLGNVRG